MANSTDKESQGRNIALWNNRPVVLIQEEEDGEYYFHGLMVGPAGMDYQTALKLLDDAYIEARKSGGDEWNYDDVLAAMKAKGFEEILAAQWWENAVDVPEALTAGILWIRCGDSDNYNKFDGMSEAADYLAEMGAKHPLYIQGPTDPAVAMGLTDMDSYQNQNYISIYWGGNKPDDVGRGITEAELKELNEALSRVARK
jgi:hypothetical protein